MELHQLRCFVAVADDLHFGKAARRLDMLPSALGRHIRLLEDSLGTQLLLSTTRNVTLLGRHGASWTDARALIARADELGRRFRDRGRSRASTLRIGAIDTAAAGLVPMLLRDFRKAHADVTVQLLEDKTIRLLPRLLSGAVDLAFVRPPGPRNKRIEFLHAVPRECGRRGAGAAPACRPQAALHPVAGRPALDRPRPALAPAQPRPHDQAVRQGRPPPDHRAGRRGKADHRQPRRRQHRARDRSALDLAHDRYGRPLRAPRGEGSDSIEVLPLAAAWLRGSRDPPREKMLDILKARLPRYAAEA